MPASSSQASILSAPSATEAYKPPQPWVLADLLDQDTPVRSYEVDFNTRESTPLILASPLQGRRLKAQAAKCALVKYVSETEAQSIRQPIPSEYYWRTEANHFREAWNMAIQKPSKGVEKRTTAEDVRDSISEECYWDIELTQYSRWLNGTLENCLAKPGPYKRKKSK